MRHSAEVVLSTPVGKFSDPEEAASAVRDPGAFALKQLASDFSGRVKASVLALGAYDPLWDSRGGDEMLERVRHSISHGESVNAAALLAFLWNARSGRPYSVDKVANMPVKHFSSPEEAADARRDPSALALEFLATNFSRQLAGELAERAAGTGWDDWSHWGPGDRDDKARAARTRALRHLDEGDAGCLAVAVALAMSWNLLGD